MQMRAGPKNWPDGQSRSIPLLRKILGRLDMGDGAGVGICVPTYPDGQEKNLRGREFDSNPFSILFLLECEIGREKIEGFTGVRRYE